MNDACPQIDRSVDRNVRPSLPRAVLALSVALGAAPACRASDAAPEAKRTPLPVEVAELSPEPRYRRAIWFRGQVRGTRSSRLGFELGGRVRAVLVDEGARVRSGQVLARLDTRKLRAAERQLVAALEKARAQKELSELTARRLGQLAADRHAAAQQADEARFGSEVAKASLGEAEAGLDGVRVDLRKSVLRAPFDGVVTGRRVDEGAVVGPGAPVLELLGDDRAEAFVGVPAGLLGAAPVGSRHPAEVDGRPIEVEVVGVVDEIDPRSRTAGLVLQLPPDDGWIEGQVIRVRIEEVVACEGFWLPLGSLRPGPRGTWQILRVEDGRAVLGAVSVEHVEGDRVFATGPQPAGARVIASGQHRVVPGQAVRALNEGPGR